MNASDSPSGGFRRLRELWRTRWPVFVVTVCVTMLVGLYATLNVPRDVYEAKAVLLGRTADAPAGPAFATRVLSRDVLETAARDMHLLRDDALPSDREPVVARLEGMLTVVSPGPAEIEIVARGHDPDELVRLVNAVAHAHVTRVAEAVESAESAARSRRETREAELRSLVDDEKKTSEALEAARAALARFEAEHADVLGAPGVDLQKTLNELADDLKETTRTVAELRGRAKTLEAGAEMLRDKLKAVTEFVETRETTVERDPERVMLEREIRLMERQLEEMLKTYTYKHPEVIKQQMNLLVKKRQLRELNTRVETQVRSTREPNPQYTALKGKLDDKMVELQQARSALEQVEGKPETLAKRVETLRALVGEHLTLADSVKKLSTRHQGAKSALETKQAEPADAEVAVAGAPVVRLEADRDSVRRAGPLRSLWFSATTLVALALGLGAMSTAFHLGPHFASAFEVSRVAGVTSLGTVGAVEGTEAARRRRLRRLVRAGVLAGVVIVTVAAAWVMLSTAP